VDVVSAPAAVRRARGSLVVVGLTGLAAAAVGVVCCATPALVVMLGAVGLGATAHAAGTAIDVVAVPLGLISIALIAVGISRLRGRS
jgi:hypothetical protein